MNKMNYIKNFKIFEADLINFPLKSFIYVISKKIDDKLKFGINKFEFDFLYEKILPIKFNLIIECIVDEDINYHGQIDHNQVKKLNFNGFDVEIKMNDIEINYDMICSKIGHELKHVFDIYYQKPYLDASNISALNQLTEKYNFNKYFMGILYLTYLSLRFEMEARNQEIYDMLRWLKTFDSIQIKNEFEKSYIYQYLMDLKNFDIDNIIDNVEDEHLLFFINDYYNSLYKTERVITDSKEFLNKLKLGFSKISDEYLDKAYLVLKEIIIDNKPYMEKRKFIELNYLYEFYMNDDINLILKNFLKSF